MSDDLKGQVEAEGQTAEPMPSSEQPVEGTQEPTLPDGVKERTAEEFEKLKESNRLLKEQLEALKNPSFQFVPPMLDEGQSNQGFDTQVPNPMAGATSSTEQDFVDEGGYVDTALLKQKLSKAEQKAEEASRIASQAVQKVSELSQNEIKKSVYGQFPEVDPNSGQFDPDFDKKVKLELTRQLVENGKQNYLEAAKEVKRLYYQKPEAQKNEAEQEKIISAREQASAQTGTSKGSSEPIDQDELVAGTRRGDADAIYKRLQASGN